MKQHQEEWLQKRVVQLERWFKITLCGWILSMAIWGLSLGMREVTAQSKIIKAQGLVIVDDKGNPRIELTARNKMCEIILYDSKKNKRITLDVKSDGTPRIGLYSGKQQIGISIHSGYSFIGLTDAEKNLRCLLSVDRKGLTVLNFCDDKKNIDFFGISVEPKGMVAIRLFDMTGKLRIGIGVLPNGTPDLRFFDGRGRVIFKAP